MSKIKPKECQNVVHSSHPRNRNIANAFFKEALLMPGGVAIRRYAKVLRLQVCLCPKWRTSVEE